MFESSRLKIKRANQHVENLNDVLASFLHTDFYVFNVEKNPDTGDNSLNFRLTLPPPSDLPLILGDAIHNLRSALDHAFVELVTRIGNEPSKWTTLRIYKDRAKLIDTLGNGILEGAPDVIAMLADTVKTYKGGNDLLCALDSLDILDKHMLLIPTFGIAALSNFDAEITMEGGGKIVMNRCSAGVGQDGILRMVGFSGNATFEVKNKGQPSIGVLFGKETGLEGQSIIPTLTQLSQLVSGVIQVFENTLTIRKIT